MIARRLQRHEAPDADGNGRSVPLIALGAALGQRDNIGGRIDDALDQRRKGRESVFLLP
jgi:hypothetical protein